MRSAFIYLLCVSSLLALEGRLSLGHLGPAGEEMMLERRSLSGTLKSDTFWSAGIQLEQRTFEKIYSESRLTVVPAVTSENWQAGLGAHYRSIRLPQLNIDNGIWQPAVSAAWINSGVLLRGMYISADLFEAEAAFMRRLLVPLEFNLFYRRDDGYFDGSRFSILAYLHSQAGIGTRYFSKSEALSVMGWVRPNDALAVRLEYYLPSALRSFSAIEISLEYRFGSSLQRNQRLPQRSAAVLESPGENIDVKKKINAPAYAVMVRRGIDPLEALAIARANDVCAGSIVARRLLQVSPGSCG